MNYKNSGQTAMHRKKASAPARYLHERGLLSGRILDFGCGHGDLRFLPLKGDLWEWDPAHRTIPTLNGEPKGFIPIKQFDIVYCGYVLNTVSYHEEKTLILPNLMKFINYDGNIFIVVRRDIPQEGTNTQRYVTLPFEITKETTSYCIYRIGHGSKLII